MKSFYKISFIAAGCMIAIGLIFGLVGAAFGGNRQLRDMAQNGELSYSIDGWNFANHFIRDNVLWRFGDGYEKNTESTSKSTYAASGIKKLDLDIGAAELSVMTNHNSDEFMISTNEPNKFEYGISDSDTFYVRSVGMVRNRGWNPEIELYVPEDMKFDDVVVNVGAGVVNMTNLICDDMNIQVGAGEYVGSDIIAQDLKCDIGVGSITLSDAEMDTTDFKVGMGAMYISGEISGDTDIQCGMGSVYLDLSGDAEDYNYEVSCSAGTVDIDGESITAVSGSRRINNNSDVTFDVDCSMGSVEIDF